MRAFLFLGQFLTGCFLMGMLPLIATAAPRKENETPILVDLTGTRSLAEIKASTRATRVVKTSLG